MGTRAKIGILVGPGGRGSNMAALAGACTSGDLEAEVAAVITPKEDIPAVALARKLRLCVCVVEPGDRFGERLALVLKERHCELVCLAGFTRLLPSEVLAQYPGRVLNIHPALLPKFGGKGMYGKHVHEAVLAAGETESGCTVHLVNERYDEGQILLRMTCPVLDDDTPDRLALRVLELEHIAYPAAIKLVLSGAGRR